MRPGKVLSLSFLLSFASAGILFSQAPGPQQFRIGQDGLATKINAGELSLTARFLAPNTSPQIPQPSAWKPVSDTSAFMKLGGVSGRVKTTSWSAGTALIDCQTWVAEKNDLVAFRQIFTSRSKKPVKMNNMSPLLIDGKEFSFGSVADWRILGQFRQKNDLPRTEVPAPGKKLTCDPFFIINNSKGSGVNLLIGHQTFSLHLADISISFDNTLNLNDITANCDFEGVEIPAGGSRTSQWVIIATGENANTLMSDYAERVRAYYDIKEPGRNALSVYCTWYYHAENYNEELLKGDIAQFKKEHLPFDAFLIDECWDMNKWGDFEANSKFPDGMKWVADQISSAGYMPGIWTAPYLVDQGSNLVNNHPEWLLRNSKGVLCTFNMNNKDHNILDLTYPGVCEYLEDQYRKLSRDWGFRYFKFDFMRSVFLDTDQQFHDRSSTSLEAYRKGLEAIRRGVGNDAYISVCGGHYGASLGIAQTQRSGSDVKSQWNNTELPKYRQNILRTWMSGLWHVDADAMMVRRQENANPDDKRDLTTGHFTDGEAFTNTVNQFIAGNLVTFTEDFAKIDHDRKMLYRHVVPSVNASSVPLDPFNLVCPEIMLTKILPLCKDLTPWNIITVINWSNEPKDYSIRMDSNVTGNLAGGGFLVYDFESMKIISRVEKGGILDIKGIGAHLSKVLKIVPWDGKSAMFVGTDLSFSCGGIELSEIALDDGVITGKLETGWFVPVKLSFVVPIMDGFELRQITVTPGQRHFTFNY